MKRIEDSNFWNRNKRNEETSSSSSAFLCVCPYVLPDALKARTSIFMSQPLNSLYIWQLLNVFANLLFHEKFYECRFWGSITIPVIRLRFVMLYISCILSILLFCHTIFVIFPISVFFVPCCSTQDHALTITLRTASVALLLAINKLSSDLPVWLWLYSITVPEALILWNPPICPPTK